MLARIDLRGHTDDPRPFLPRADEGTVVSIRDAARAIVDDVAARGDAALAEHSERLDGYDGSDGWLIPPDAAQARLEAVDPALRAAMERAAARIRWFHERGRATDWREELEGVVLGVRHQPLERVACYVPGGVAPLVSTTLMSVVPALLAGVEEVVVCTPPGPEGRGDDNIVAAAALAGAHRIVTAGGAQAVAALAYGTAALPRCDKVVGPGNAYVNEAKALVAARGVCGIDGFAGTTEVAVIADDTADPRHVAVDLIAQAEHDPLVTALLITPSTALADAVDAVITDEVAQTRHADRVRAALRGQGGVVLVDDLDQAVVVADAFAAEHLQVQTADAAAVAERVRFAGAIFVGAMSPVPLGDFAAGSNHTLPTAGRARWAGGLRTDDFTVPVSWIQADADALSDLAPVVEAFGAAEDLPAHAHAVAIRLKDHA